LLNPIYGETTQMMKMQDQESQLYVDDSKWIKSDVKTSKKIKGKRNIQLELTKYGFTQHLAQSQPKYIYICTKYQSCFAFFFSFDTIYPILDELWKDVKDVRDVRDVHVRGDILVHLDSYIVFRIQDNYTYRV